MFTAIKAAWAIFSPKVWVVILTGLLFSHTLAWYTGIQYQKDRQAAATTRSVITQVKAAPKNDARVVEKIRDVHHYHREVIRELPQIIQSNPVCDLPEPAVSLLNRNRAMPAVPPNDGTGAAAATNN